MRWCIPMLMLACDPAAGVPDPTRFAFPVVERELMGDIIGVDHDEATGEGLLGRMMCLDYVERGFPHCYDGHDGSDYLLVGGFDTMDAGSAEVVAAAPGQVVLARDGEYDRCRAAFDGSIDCDGHPQIANAVVIEHADGMRSMYWHLMRDSVAVEVGQHVQRGDRLGLVGSSGTSSLPHLHFEVQTPSDDVVDPYAGPASQETSWWCDQGIVDALPGDCP